MARSSFRARAASRSRAKTGARGGGKGGIAKYAIPAVAGAALLYFLLRSPDASAKDKEKGDNPKPPDDKVIPPPSPPGPRPPNTWGDLPTAIVQVVDPDPGATPGVRTRTQPSASAPLVPYGEGSAAYTAYNGKTVAVLETGRFPGDGREWWRIITPGGYEGWASAGQTAEVTESPTSQQPNMRRASARQIPGTTVIVQRANASGPTAGTAGTQPFRALSPATLRTLDALNASTGAALPLLMRLGVKPQLRPTYPGLDLTRPGFSPADLVKVGDRVFIRTQTNDIYLPPVIPPGVESLIIRVEMAGPDYLSGRIEGYRLNGLDYLKDAGPAGTFPRSAVYARNPMGAGTAGLASGWR